MKTLKHNPLPTFAEVIIIFVVC